MVVRAPASARFTCTKSARACASAAPPFRSTAAGWSVGMSTAPSRNGNSWPRSFVMPSLVSRSSFVAKLPSVTTTEGSMNSTCASRYGTAALDLERERVAVARRPALHDVRDVDRVAVEPDALDQAREQPAGAARRTGCRRGPPAPPGPRRRTSARRRGRRRRTPPACASPRAGTSCTRARRVRGLRTMRTPVVQVAVRARTRDTSSTAAAREVAQCYATADRTASAVTSVARTRRRSMCASTSPVAAANAMSPSWRVCEGWIARTSPWCALSASSRHSSFVHRALVATTANVVLVSSSNGSHLGEARRCPRARSNPRACGRRRRTRRRPRSPPRARRPRASPSRALAEPRPPGTAYSPPRHLPTVAPRPAPTTPIWSGRAARPARPRARRGLPRARAVTPPDATRSKIAAAGTSGTGPPRVGNPRPSSASARITPSAATSPNAEPPDEHDRVDVLRRCDRARAARSRGSPARHRGSRPSATVSGGNTITVTPVTVAGPVPDADAGHVGDHRAAAWPLRVGPRAADRARSRR